MSSKHMYEDGVLRIRTYDIHGIGRHSHIMELLPNQVNCLVGPNGSGKSTAIRILEEWAKKNTNNYEFVSYENLDDGSRHNSLSDLLGWNIDIQRASDLLSSSEGQGIIINLGTFIQRKASYALARARDKGKNLIICLDGLDSGTSIDTIEDIKTMCLNSIIEKGKELGVPTYLVITANMYALARDYRCINAYTLKDAPNFKTYRSFENFVMKLSNKIQIDMEENDNG